MVVEGAARRRLLFFCFCFAKFYSNSSRRLPKPVASGVVTTSDFVAAGCCCVGAMGCTIAGFAIMVGFVTGVVVAGVADWIMTGFVVGVMTGFAVVGCGTAAGAVVAAGCAAGLITMRGFVFGCCGG